MSEIRNHFRKADMTPAHPKTGLDELGASTELFRCGNTNKFTQAMNLACMEPENAPPVLRPAGPDHS